MLVLSRRPGEVLIIGTGPDAVRVQVVTIDGNRVRLSFVAPAHVRIDRQELRDKGDARRAAAGGEGKAP